MQTRRDRQPGRFMTSLLAVALAVSTLGATSGAARLGGHGCCQRLTSHCPTVLQCCARDRRDSTPAPAPDARALGTPASEGASTGTPVAALTPLPPAPVTLVRHVTAPPLLYLHHATFLI